MAVPLWSCSFSLSIFTLYDNVRWEMNIYDAHPQGRASPRGKPSRTKFTAFSPPHSLRIKLQIYSTAAPCLRVHLAFFMNENWRTYNTGDHARFAHESARDLNSYAFRGNRVCMLDTPSDLCQILVSGFESHPQSGWGNVYRRRGLRHQIGSGNLYKRD